MKPRELARRAQNYFAHQQRPPAKIAARSAGQWPTLFIERTRRLTITPTDDAVFQRDALLLERC
jgi:hypothetical protein